jgi:hypothetical protein
MTFLTQLRKEIMEQFRTRRFHHPACVGYAFPPDGKICW